MRKFSFILLILFSLNCQAELFDCPSIDDIKSVELKKLYYAQRHTTAKTYQLYTFENKQSGSSHQWEVEVVAYGKFDLSHMQENLQTIDTQENLFATYYNSAKFRCHYEVSFNPMIHAYAYHYRNTR